ncbi:uncharacterized protein AB675_10770 [Cyphellophora attinorum]|uniref:Secreted protein n=1 Tax=Cyphellophora attinorum TaxID=1664694 RepID=A0A0N1HV11_9EURO|nr:uncharacterized protein AB675_10770 [Phialophora attinorum]KPI40974.1 hypothetical protein AB675_10770 [Phialophora attinorum]
MLSSQLLVKGVALAFIATATAVWTGKDMGTAGSESCEFIPLNGDAEGTGPQKICSQVIPTYFANGTVERQGIFGNRYYTGKVPQTGRNDLSQCMNIEQINYDTQSPTGDSLVMSNACTTLSGWQYLKVYDQKACPGPEMNPRTQLYAIKDGFPTKEQIDRGTFHCFSVSASAPLRSQ